MSKQKARRRPWRGDASHRDHTENAIRAAAPPWRRCLRCFSAWLEAERELAPASITVRIASTRTFLQGQQGSGVRALKRLGVEDLEDFFVEHSKRRGPGANRSMQAAMRLFLRFAATRGWVKPGLADAVPRMRSYRLSHIPRGMRPDDVHALVSLASSLSARNRAIVLLLATYGLRRGQVCALSLEDIDWRAKTILIRAHKGGKAVLHRLLPAVADAIAEYVQRERPTVETSTVFLSTSESCSALSPSGLSSVIRRSLERLGSSCRPRGPHALRHAFATRLVQGGQPLKVIADLLGHRSLAAVSVYAKVDHPRLLEVASEWPEVAS